ncbi:MAG: RdgB/HAM1 family non-canonical purine NTP pyrophosphatase [Clostridia bacterium]|nr:RdgB/HAM1 family non-canonical purine NTP pyrophosphatase [Clostridia bacterium]
MNKLLIATNNQKKLKELSAILIDLGFECVTLRDMGLDIDPEETGTTFAENSYIKAKCGMEASGLPCIADDSGLAVDALDGAPGIYSARYCEGTDEDRVAFLLKNMENVADSDRTARFVSAITCVFPNGDTISAEGYCEGVITRQVMGDGGFGYDPVFLVPEHKATFAQIPQAVKNEISHRANALKIFKAKMELYLKEGGLK